MPGKRGLLFAAAAAGALLALTGFGIVIWAWLYPGALVDALGASVTPNDLVEGLQTQFLGTIIGGLAGAAGLAAAIFSFQALDRDLDRMRAEVGIGRGAGRR